jgi:low affinity Fe/Cu permease
MFGTNPTPLRSDASIDDRHWTSRLLHRVGATTAHSGAGATAGLLLAAWLAVGAITGFAHWWELVLYSATSGVTLLMVFVIQHTQARQTTAMQRKLDELLRSSSHADSTYIATEEAPDDDLETLAGISQFQRERARQDKLNQ